ncbi:MAG TPA: phosphoribosyltransferase domain-containing protein [Flavobacteriaceae bacterium]|nr:phosphoribosyltransferase domain-containing protein [Flavobacteriaceae bacterium]
MQISTNQILDNTQIQNIVRRIAYQIYESNINEERVILAGIAENGFLLAEKIKTQLEIIAPIKAELCAVKINKKKPLEPVTTSLEVSSYKGQSVVLIDDVLNSGTTLIYGVKHFLDVPLKRFKTAVLVNRNHKKYPVKADFKGISLSTSLRENITVIFEEGNDRAVLD